MITEIAQIDVKPGMEAEFETGVKTPRGVPARQGLPRPGVAALHREARPLPFVRQMG